MDIVDYYFLLHIFLLNTLKNDPIALIYFTLCLAFFFLKQNLSLFFGGVVVGWGCWSTANKMKASYFHLFNLSLSKRKKYLTPVLITISYPHALYTVIHEGNFAVQNNNRCKVSVMVLLRFCNICNYVSCLEQYADILILKSENLFFTKQKHEIIQ